MKIKQLFLIIPLALLFITSSCGKTIKPSEDSNNKKALSEIQKEPKIKYATITDDNILYASVEDDGTIRNGYAEYLCEILKENNATTNWVKIVKVSSSKDLNNGDDHGILLGEANCN